MAQHEQYDLAQYDLAQYDLALCGGMVMTPSGLKQTDVGIKDGVFTHVGSIEPEQAVQCVDVSGLHVLPGLIDSQVHFREPGLEYKEDLEAGTRGAVLGGVTAIFEMPNTNPATITKEALEDKLDRAAQRAWCDHAFFVGGTPDVDVDWHALEMLPGCSGIKIFMGSSTGSLLVSEDEAIERILSQTTRSVAVHCEDEARLNERFHLAEDGANPSFHPVWRDEETALRASSRLVAIAKRLNKKVHVLHVTTAEEMAMLPSYSDVATVECLPQHLTFCDEDYDALGSRIQMNPPIRAARHRDAIWQAIADGVVDVLGSDHAPHTLDEKSKTYPQSPSGMPGVQTIVPVMLDHVNAGKLSLERLVDLMCVAPCRVYKVANKGQITNGYDADVTIVDMNKEQLITDEMMATKSGWTPYDGKTVKGWPTHTIIRGKIVMQSDELLVQPGYGKPVLFEDTKGA